jgi:alginate O-acetyltransferase complex protein AlgI
MAIGLARVFGFRFPENFNYPYYAASIRDFWRRWHISLSTWFRDYLYIPLGGSRSSAGRTYFNLVLVFFLCGLWHGASWTFVAWGLFHGIFLAIERATNLDNRLEAPGGRVFGHVYALLIVMVGWVFFRSETLEGALGFISTMFGLSVGTPTLDYVGWLLKPDIILILCLAPFLALPIGTRIFEKLVDIRQVSILASVTTDILIFALFVLSVAYIAGGTYNPFIYYRF